MSTHFHAQTGARLATTTPHVPISPGPVALMIAARYLAHPPRRGRPRSASTKRRLADAIEAASLSSAEPSAKRETLVDVVYNHARMLASERAASLPNMVHDDLISEVGERTALALARLDLDAPPAQQVAYLDGQLRHALADACRAVDPLGRGPRALRKRFESAWDEAAQRWGREPSHSEQEAILEELVGTKSPVLRMIVGHGVTPAAGVAAYSGEGRDGEDISERVASDLARAEIAEAVTSHPDPEIGEYLAKVASGERARRPSNFHRRLGPTLSQVVAAHARAQWTASDAASA